VAAIPATAAPATTPSPSPTPTPDRARGPEPEGDQGPAPSEPDPTPRLGLTLERTVVSAGDIVRVNVTIENGRSVSSVPMHILFDPDVLEFLGAREGSVFRSTSQQPLLLAGVNPAYPNDLGIGLALVRSSGLLTGSGSLLILEFKAVHSGQSDLRFDNSSLRGSLGESVPVELQNTTVEVR
jgi:Cohesin domain